MRLIVLTASAALLCASVAFAQPAVQGPQNPAVKGMHENTSSVPVKGANSFTMGEAKMHIEAKGFTKVKSLKKDANGVWRGKAMKDGMSVPVSLDYQGNVN